MLICPSCGFGSKGEWKPRVANPVKCPRCWTHLKKETDEKPQAGSRKGVHAITDGKKGANSRPGVRRKGGGSPVSTLTPAELPSVKACPACGGMNGMHQKNCKARG
jgi:hypothetical protein